MTDTEYLKKLAEEDKAVQEQFYIHFAPKILSLCIRYLTDRKEAEDAMIQSLLKALQKIKTYKGEGSFEAWVKRIAVNECLNILKKQVSFNVVSLRELSDEDYSINEDIDIDYLLKIIGELPAGYRAVFNLYAIEGYSHSEVADMLGISVSTSKSQLSRARSLLKKKLMFQNKKSIYNE